MRGLLLLCLLGTVLGLDDGTYNWLGPGEEYVDPGPLENVCPTDPAGCGCCLMNRTMRRMEEYFNQSLNDLQEELNRAKMTLNGIRSSQSGFSAALMDSRECIGPSRDTITVIYKHVFFNLGDNYDSSTGVFTVPRGGVYVLALTVYSDSGAPSRPLDVCAALYVNEEEMAKLNDRNSDDQEDSATVVLALRLKPGDQVKVQLPPGCSLCDDGSHYNTFSAFLLYGTESV